MKEAGMIWGTLGLPQVPQFFDERTEKNDASLYGSTVFTNAKSPGFYSILEIDHEPS
jgi:hypothetical protein